MKHYPIMIVGVGRSGTSVVAGILRQLGFFMGFEFMPAPKANPLGCWEDKELFELNMAFYNKQINLTQWFSGFVKFKEKREKLDRPWGFKEPNLSLFIPYVIKAIPNIRFIYCKRNIDAIVRSFSKLQNWNYKRSYEVVRVRERLIEYYLRNIPHLTVQYEELIKNKNKVVETIFQYIYEPYKKEAINYIKS